MNEKIIVSELLKNCPTGMELYSPMFDNLYFDYIDDESTGYPIKCYTKSETKNTTVVFNEYGEYTYLENAKCVIFPKGKDTWEGFNIPFNDGDVAISDKGDIHLLRTKDSSYCAYRYRWKGLPKFDSTITTSVKVVRLATEEEKQKLFKEIKDNGYKWNPVTKTLDKLCIQEFKDGDIVYTEKGNIAIVSNMLDEKKYDSHVFFFKELNKLVRGTTFYPLRLATKEEKETLFKKIEDDGYKWNPKTKTLYKLKVPIEGQDDCKLMSEKFDISTLKLFDKVLVRNNDKNEWLASFYSHYDEKNMKYHYACINYIRFKQCIPYKGNEYLFKTTNDCDEYYKTWS